MEVREGDVAENQNIRSSRGAAEYSLTFEIVLSVAFRFLNATLRSESSIWISKCSAQGTAL